MESMKLLSLLDNLYAITDDGRLYSCRNQKFLRPSTDKHGYLYYVTSINGNRKTLKAHRLKEHPTATAEHFNVSVAGVWKPCDDCIS